MDGDHAQAPRLEVFVGLDELGTRVHHKWPIPGHRFPDRLAAQNEYLELGTPTFLDRVGRDCDLIAASEHDQLTLFGRPALNSEGSLAAEDIHE